MIICHSGLDFRNMNVSRPSRVKTAQIYLKRAIRWKRNSSPYISGDAFADFSDFVYNPPRWRNLNRCSHISKAKIIYCRSHELQDMLDKHSHEINAQVIVSGNSDFEFYSIPSKIPKSVCALFLQNSFISDHKFIFTIPIGLENYRLSMNGNPRFLRPRGSYPVRTNRILFGPLSPTHPIRKRVIKEFKEEDPKWDVLSSRLSPKMYGRISNSYNFVAAVRGNGIDTHRIWEALYRGATPVVINDNWWRSLQDLFPQVISISDWNKGEIENMINSGAKSNFNPLTIEALWMPFWEKKINTFLEARM